MNHEIQDRARFPVSLATLLDIDSEELVVEPKSLSSCVDAIACCVTAFQSAAAATEHSECNEIAEQICSYAHTIAREHSPYRRHYIMELIHQYTENRTYDVALRNILDLAFIEGESWLREGCLNIIEFIRKTLTDEGNAMRHKLGAARRDTR